MRRLALFLLFVPSIAFAQDDSVAREINATTLAIQHLVEKMSLAASAAVQRREREIYEYAKACGDKPGCFLPVDKKPE